MNKKSAFPESCTDSGYRPDVIPSIARDSYEIANSMMEEINKIQE